VQRSDSLHEAYWLARRLEQSYPFKKNTQGYSPFPAKSGIGYKQGSGRTAITNQLKLWQHPLIQKGKINASDAMRNGSLVINSSAK
jgi:hypothetical protein